LHIFFHKILTRFCVFEPTFCEAQGRGLQIMRRLVGGSQRHRFAMISNLLVKRKGWNEFGRLAGRGGGRGQQFVGKIQTKFGLLKSKKENVQKF